MIALPNQGCFANVLPLIRTLFDIVLLRKGPEDIPRSWFLLVVIVVLWIFSTLVAVALVDQIDESDFFPSLFSGVIGVLCYGAVIVARGFPMRVLQTVSAVLGSGALISLVFVAEYVLFSPLLGEVPTVLIADLILLWSVPVEGHIIARTIGSHWYVGILIAIAVFVLQFVVFSAISATP